MHTDQISQPSPDATQDTHRPRQTVLNRHAPMMPRAAHRTVINVNLSQRQPQWATLTPAEQAAQRAAQAQRDAASRQRAAQRVAQADAELRAAAGMSEDAAGR